ncbi:hypothetical protein Kpol_1060p29 [Vanderwaltozyma polyspora DSM 70294]|uniref:RING-CH-type domain-containing protein n=1 Tax=Vanderwaltozyma polyspora (strain ATCC 22028 / DSM 70294 / BCRC 21397 / CBS 2163 / NBRC 10782 / NRRL Y-8283 / UCD 57-17) TaxID=436907 RepID=A7TK27_VANPO|nr:uncharacterized protein Kpol_1060p29 [Vanderwaltozyma polyspora DSM 70294]EDO17373.1 hypothetical protein Kpol_1060p29 [Vanderwaltozyma polyspora DSM 70294]
MVIGLPNKKCFCWICLDESSFDSSWIRHECGCNLQLHKKCYMKWLYNLNKKQMNERLSVYDQGVSLDSDLTSRMFYLVDGHLDFCRELSTAEIITSIPVVGVPLFSILCIPLLTGLTTFGIKYLVKLIFSYVPLKPPITHAECPQCKKYIETRAITFRSRSIVLELYYQLKRMIRTGTVLVAVTLSTLNLGKWWFKLGLWQLRKIFPEDVLRVLLDISTTKALDVYSETINGLISVPNSSKFLIFGFPLYLFSLTDNYSVLNKWRWLWSLVATIRVSYYDSSSSSVMYNIFSSFSLLIWSYSNFISPLVEYKYKELVARASPYYLDSIAKYQGDNNRSQRYSDILIKSSWYDNLFDSIIWPVCGSLLGNKLLRCFLWLRRNKIISWDPDMAPNLFSMLCKLVGCAVVAMSAQGLKYYMSYKRMKELRELQSSILDTM